MSTIIGKKVFFVYPHSVVQEKLIEDLIDREYEVYLVKDHRKLELICEYFISPIIFINIDEGLKEPEWDTLIRSLMEKVSTNHARIGILTYNDNPELSQKYLMDIMVPCGFIKLKLGIRDSSRIIIKTLEANEAKGNRKFVRASCDPEDARFNVDINDRIENGSIVDISSVGMTVCFDNYIDLPKNSFLPELQLKLKGILITVNAAVLGFRNRDNEKTIYVLMFDNRISTLNKTRIRNFIRKTLQSNLERKLNLQYTGSR